MSTYVSSTIRRLFIALLPGIALLVLATPAVAQELPPPPARIHITHWYVDSVTDAYLHLSQLADAGASEAPFPRFPMPIKVTLRPWGTGAPIVFDVSVPIAGVLAVPLKPYLPPLTGAGGASPVWGNGSKAGSMWGTAEITMAPGYEQDLEAIDAELLSSGLAGGFAVKASDTSRLGLGGDQSAVVVRKTAGSRIFLVLKDSSGRSTQSYYLSWNGGGFFALSQPLPSYTGTIVELTNQVPVGAVKSLTVTTSTGWPALAMVLTVDEASGLVTSQPMEETQAGDPTVWAPPIPWGGTWNAQLAVVNNGQYQVQIIPAFTWYNALGQQQTTSGYSFSVPAHGSTLRDLAGLGVPAGISQVAVQLAVLSTSPNVTAAVYQGNSSSPRLSMPVPMISTGNAGIEKSAVGFRLGAGENDTRAIIGATHVGDVAGKAILGISYTVAGQPRTWSTYKTVQPGGFVLYDLRTLRDSQAVGMEGYPLPADLQEGNAHLWGEFPLSGQDATFSLAGGWTIQCAEVCRPIGGEPREKMHRLCFTAGGGGHRFPGGTPLYTQEYTVYEGPRNLGGGRYRYSMKACPPLNPGICAQRRETFSFVTDHNYIQGTFSGFFESRRCLFGICAVLCTNVDIYLYSDPCPGPPN